MDSGDLQKAIVIPALIDGKSFCEDVKSTEEYLHIKERIEESTWSAEYIQDNFFLFVSRGRSLSIV